MSTQLKGQICNPDFIGVITLDNVVHGFTKALIVTYLQTHTRAQAVAMVKTFLDGLGVDTTRLTHDIAADGTPLTLTFTAYD